MILTLFWIDARARAGASDRASCVSQSTILYRFEDDGSRRWGTCALVLPLSCQMLLTNPPCRVGTAMCNGTLARYIDAYLAQPFYESGPAARVFARVPGPPTPPSPPSPYAAFVAVLTYACLLACLRDVY